MPTQSRYARWRSRRISKNSTLRCTATIR
jgi:hypothetical protein